MHKTTMSDSDNSSTSSIGSGPYVSDNEVIQCCDTESDALEEDPDQATTGLYWYITDAEKEDIRNIQKAGLIYPATMQDYLSNQYPVICKWIKGMIQDGWGFAAYSIKQMIRKGGDAHKIKTVLFDACCVSSTKPLKVLTFTSNVDDTAGVVKYNANLARMIINHIEDTTGHCMSIVHGDLDKRHSVKDMTQKLDNLEETAQKMFLPESLHMDVNRYRDVSHSLLNLFSHSLDRQGNGRQMLMAETKQTRGYPGWMKFGEDVPFPDPPMPPLGVSFSSYDRFSCTLEWKPPLLDTASLLKGYIIEKKEMGSEWQKTGMCSVKQTSLTVCDVKEGTTVQFRVRAVNDAGLGEPSIATEVHTVGISDMTRDKSNPYFNSGMNIQQRSIVQQQVGCLTSRLPRSLTDDDKAGKSEQNIIDFREGDKQRGQYRQTEFQRRWGPHAYQSWNEEEVEKIRKELHTHCQKQMKDNLKILLFGPTGHGKSSLGNSFLSGLDTKDHVSHMFTVGSGQKTVSAAFNSVKILGGHFLIDMPGIFESKAVTDARIEDIVSGKVPFYAELSTHLRVKGIQTDPPPGKNDVSCVVIVLRYDAEMGEEVRRHLDLIKRLAGKGVITYQLVLTHLDECDHQFRDSRRLPYLYESNKVQDTVSIMSEETGIPPYCISFVKNYVNETEKHPHTTLLHLRVLKKIISTAYDQTRKRKDMMSMRKIYTEGFLPSPWMIGVVMTAVLAIYFAICYSSLKD